MAAPALRRPLRRLALLLPLLAACGAAASPAGPRAGAAGPAAASARAGPAPPVWPKAFSARFETTILELGVFAANSTLYYDYTLPAQRIDFDVCADGSGSACSFIFNGSSAYILHADGSCCANAPVGPPPPTWPAELAYNGTARAGGQDVELWVGGTPSHHLFYNRATDSMAFLLVTDVNEQWAVQEPFRVGPQDPSLFYLPPACGPC